MPVKDRNPFGPAAVSEAPVSKADVGVPDPFRVQHNVVTCPTCSEKDPSKIRTRSLPTQILRKCTTCGQEWAGGGETAPPTLPRQQETEDDIPDDPRMSGTEQWFK